MANKGEKVPVPIMDEASERFMAFEGLVQWTAATVEQANRIEEATAKAAAGERESARLLWAQTRTEHHYFAICANKVLEHRDWVARHGLCQSVDFSLLDQFSRRDIRDLRNMREHVVDYFRGLGNAKGRWTVETPEYKADASSAVGTLIGGRLDWSAFARAAEKLLSELLAEPIPFPEAPNCGFQCSEWRIAVTQSEPWALLLKGLSLFGSVSAVAVAIAAFVSKMVADRSIERHRADLGRETERLKSELAKETETHKLTLKKQEILYGKEIEAVSAFLALHRSLQPEYRGPGTDWEGIMIEFAGSFENVESELRNYMSRYGAAVSRTNRIEIETCMILAAKHKFDGREGDEAKERAIGVAHDILDGLHQVELAFLEEIRGEAQQHKSSQHRS